MGPSRRRLLEDFASEVIWVTLAAFACMYFCHMDAGSWRSQRKIVFLER
jgi:hypothetical protein